MDALTVRQPADVAGIIQALRSKHGMGPAAPDPMMGADFEGGSFVAPPEAQPPVAMTSLNAPRPILPPPVYSRSPEQGVDGIFFEGRVLRVAGIPIELTQPEFDEALALAAKISNRHVQGRIAAMRSKRGRKGTTKMERIEETLQSTTGQPNMPDVSEEKVSGGEQMSLLLRTEPGSETPVTETPHEGARETRDSFIEAAYEMLNNGQDVVNTEEGRGETLS